MRNAVARTVLDDQVDARAQQQPPDEVDLVTPNVIDRLVMSSLTLAQLIPLARFLASRFTPAAMYRSPARHWPTNTQ